MLLIKCIISRDVDQCTTISTDNERVKATVHVLPGRLELRLVSESLLLGLRTGSTHMRNKWEGLMARLIQRVVASLRAGESKRRGCSSPQNEAGLLAFSSLCLLFRAVHIHDRVSSHSARK